MTAEIVVTDAAVGIGDQQLKREAEILKPVYRNRGDQE